MPAGLDFTAYTKRIGYSGPLSPDLTVLTELHAAHVAALPFENLDVLLGREIRLDLPALEHKLLAQPRGGYCFEHNVLFAAALEHVGFRVTRLAGRVHVGSPTPVPARTHMLLLVELPEGPFIADGAFGALGARVPLPLSDGYVVDGVCERKRLRRRENDWLLESEFRSEFVPLYSFTLEPHAHIDYEVANHYTATHPSSRFRHGLLVQRATENGRLVIRNDQLLTWENGQENTRQIRSRDELVDVLRSLFAIELPEAARLVVPAVPEWC